MERLINNWDPYCVIVSICLTLLSSGATAKLGGSDGGTRWSEHQFIILAQYLIDSNGIESGDRQILRKALDRLVSNSKIPGDSCKVGRGICEVDSIVDPESGAALGDDYVIFGSSNPPLIQLKKKNLHSESFQSDLEGGKTVAHLIFHELYRVSGEEDRTHHSPDDNFQLSIGKYRLDRVHFPSELIRLPQKSGGGGLASWDIEKLANYSDRCTQVRLTLLQAKLNGQAEIMRSAHLGPSIGILPEDAADLLNALARSTKGIAESLEGQSLAICDLIDRELERRARGGK